jgi:hypothetical protein
MSDEQHDTDLATGSGLQRRCIYFRRSGSSLTLSRKLLYLKIGIEGMPRMLTLSTKMTNTSIFFLRHGGLVGSYLPIQQHLCGNDLYQA